MLQTWIHRVKPGMEQRMRDWLVELNARTEEVRESLVAAGVRAEQAFLIPDAGGTLLVYVSEAADQRHAAGVYAQSTLPIDEEHRRVMADCIGETLADAPIYDVSA